jgi:UDP-N-acetylmuramate: L-alanyl-gamma-D-glutamyl-meso-diaminopimelate ligase
MEKPQHIHIIGICGVATSAIAIAFKNKGWKVTGSDKGFFPPVSTELEKHNISFYAGWHPENIGNPNIIMMGGGGTSPGNPELIYAKEKNIPLYSYAEILQKYFIKKNSIVTVGTWGKTTTSSLLSFILIKAGMDPSYFTGGLSLSHDTGALSNSDWSVVEGDEYQVSISDKRPKFVYYNPTHLLLTSVSWDHADLYPTEKAYFDTFEKLINEIPQTGKIVACIDNSGVNKIIKDKKIISYSKKDMADYFYHSITHTKNGLDFIITNKSLNYNIHSPMLGRFNAENITGCFAMACEIGIKPEIVIDAIKEFKGIKRRFEKRFEENITVLDCHAPTPEKASSVLESIREVYNNKILAIYEPNIGGRQRSSAYMYDNSFKNADIVVIPRLTKLKVSTEKNHDESDKLIDKPLEGDELTEIIKKTQPNVIYIENDNELVKYVIQNTKKDDCIVFLGSHGFRNMIEEIIAKIK